jgi:hypothetical protein
MGASCAALLLASFAPFVSFILVTIIFILDDTTPNTCSTSTCYCENVTTGSFSQPANVFSAFSFILVSWILSLYSAMTYKTLSNRFRTYIHYPLLYTILLSCVGASSMAFHLWLDESMARLDGLSIHIFISFLVCIAIVRKLRYSEWIFVGLFIVLSIFQILIIFLTPSLVKETLFGFFVAGVILLEIVPESHSTRPTRFGFLLFTVILVILAFILWLFSRDEHGILCSTESPVQGHAAWHVLLSFATLSLFFYYDSEPAVRDEWLYTCPSLVMPRKDPVGWDDQRYPVTISYRG